MIQSADRLGAASTRYGGIDANTDAFRSRHAQAVSVNCASGHGPHCGVCQSDGHPAHGDGATRGSGPDVPPPPSMLTPGGVAGTVDVVAGVVSLGRIARVNNPTDTNN